MQLDMKTILLVAAGVYVFWLMRESEHGQGISDLTPGVGIDLGSGVTVTAGTPNVPGATYS